LAETLGSLVDKLSITNLKLWFVQDAVHKAAREGEGLDAATVQKLASLNLQRNALMTEIDICLKEAVESGEAIVDAHPKVF
jgi:hypothetical protein